MTDDEALTPEQVANLDAVADTALHAMAEAHDTKRWAQCVAVGDAWLEARGSLPAVACIWYAEAQMATGHPDVGLPWAEIAATNIKPTTLSEEIGLCAARSAYAQCLASVGKMVKAKSVLKKMVKTPVLHPETLEKQGHITLAVTDKWRTGWSMHESRGVNTTLPDGLQRWDVTSQGVLGVLHEQGIGDAVLFARWLRWARETTGHDVVWFGPEREMGRWIGGLEGVTVGSRGDDRTPVDFACYAMSLPYLAGVMRPKDVPAPAAPTALLQMEKPARWDGMLRVGVCWKGSPDGWHDYERSLTYDQFAPIMAPLDGVEFVNLCYGAEVPDDAPFVSRTFRDVYETGEVIAGLDLVVTVDTSVAHLAGSLAIPTLTIVPTKPDWRYDWPGTGGTVFYPSMTVLRRQHMRDLSPVTAARDLMEQWAAVVREAAA